MGGTNDVWATNVQMTYSNWTAAINTAEGNRQVRLIRDGSWEVNTISDEETLLCNVGGSNSGKFL